MITIRLITADGELLFPVNPEELARTNSGNNDTAEIIGLGEIVIPKTPSLETFTIESFFPYASDPQSKRNLLVDMLDNKKTGRLVAEGLMPALDMTVAIQSLEFTTKAGEEKDLYFTIDFKQYRPYGAILMQIPAETEETDTVLPAETPRVDEKPPVEQTYTVVSGDSLWKISKKFSGNGANWQALYNLNSATIGSNPNLIYPGQVFTLPSEWVTA